MATKKEQELFWAIEEDNTQLAENLVKEGVNPLAVISFKDGTKFQAFLRIFIKGNLNLLDTVLKAALTRYKETGVNPIDLSQPILNGKDLSVDKKNILQDILSRSALPAIKQVIKYAKDTKQDVADLLNAPILNAIDNFTTGKDLSNSLLGALSSNNIDANLIFAPSTNMATVSEFWDKWFRLSSKKDLADLPQITLPLQIVFQGPIETLPYLMEQGLKVDKSYLEYITALSQDPDEWNSMQATRCQPSVAPTSKTQKSANGGVCFTAELGNAFNAHKIPVVIHVDYTPLKEVVENKEKELIHKYNIDKIASNAEEAMAGVAFLNTKVDVLTKEMQELKQAFSELADVQRQHYRDTLASDKTALELFNHLESNTKAQLEGGKIAALRIFNTHPSSMAQQHASSIIAVLRFATNSIPVAQNVIACIAFCQKEYAKIQTKAHYKNIADKTLGIDAPIVAINVAGHIAGKYLSIKEMLQPQYNKLAGLKNDMWANVQTSIKKLGTMQGNFVNHEHLVGYLCENAITRLSNAQLYKIGAFDNNAVHNLPRPRSPGYAASSSTALATFSASTGAMNMVYTEVVNNSGLGYAVDYSSHDASTGNTPPLVFSNKSGKRTPSPKGSDNTIHSSHSNSSGHSNRISGKKKKDTNKKCSIM